MTDHFFCQIWEKSRSLATLLINRVILLHLHEIVEGLYFHFSLSVCLSVCVCVSGSFLVNKIPAERMHRFRRGFRQMVAYNTGSDPIEFDDLGSKVKVTVTKNVCKNNEKNSPKIQI